MRLIIAGGRDFRPQPCHTQWLNAMQHALEQQGSRITAVLCGGASGADEFGKSWAISRKIPVVIHRADWDIFGRTAGPIRNEGMARVADGVVLFPGGRGTENMCWNAKKYRLRIWDWRNRPVPPAPPTESFKDL